MLKYRFTSTAYWAYTTNDYEGLTITQPVPPESIQRKIPNLKAIKIEFNKTAFKKSGQNHWEYLESLLSYCSVEFLSIQGSNELDDLPTRLTQHKLHTLAISNCPNLKNISILSELEHLKELQIAGDFFEISERFFTVSTIRKLYIASNILEGIEYLPKLSFLEDLTLVNLNIEKLPSGFSKLTSLKNLNFRQLKYLKELPRLESLTQLREINWWTLPQINSIPDDFDSLKNLNKINISSVGTDNGSIELPVSLVRHPNLKTLHIGNLPISDLPDSFSPFSKLHSVSFDNLPLKSLPQSFQNLQSLEYLRIRGCSDLKSISPIGSLRALKQLVLASLNSLPQIDFDFKKLSALEDLGLNTLPEVEYIPEFGEESNYLNKIQLIDLPKVKNIPNTLTYCYELVDLRIRNCGIESIPANLKILRKVNTFHIYHCKNLNYIPSAIFPIGTTSFVIHGCPKIQDNKPIEIRQLIRYVKEKMDSKYHQRMAYWLFNNKGKEPFSDEIQQQTLNAFSEANADLHFFLFSNLNRLNLNETSLKDAKIEQGSQVSILGTTQVKKTLLRKQLEAIGFKYSQKITDNVGFVLIGKKPKMPDNFWTRERILFSEIELSDWQKDVNPGMLQKDDTPKEFIHNIRRLLWSNMPANELVALEMIMNHGLSDDLEMDFIAVAKTSSDTNVRAKIRKFLKGNLSGGSLKVLNDQAKVKQKHPPFYKYAYWISPAQLGQLILTVHKRLGLFLVDFFRYDDGNSPYRKELLTKISPTFLEKPKYLKLQINLTENEVNEILKQPIFKGNLQRLVIHSNNIKAIPSEVFEHKTIKDLNLSGNFEKDTIPEKLFELTKLTKLTLSWNNLTAIPPEIGKLTRLKELLVYPQQAIQIPEELEKLPKLTRSYFSMGVIK